MHREAGKSKVPWLKKQRQENKKGYEKLERRIFFQTLGMVLIAFTGIWGLYVFVLYGKVANTVVAIMQVLFRMNYEDAVNTYNIVFRRNYEGMVMIPTILCFFVMFRFFLGWFTRYFQEIDRGIDTLVERDGRKVHMSREMEPMEKKLNSVLQTLEQQFEDIQSAEQKKDELVMYLAHDIRTPLTSVIGYLTLMEEMPDLTPDQRQKFLQVTREKANRLETLINEFFDITRYSRQEIELSREPIDLYYMLSQLAEEVYPLLTAGGKRISINVSEDCIIHGSADKLARVFQNLIKNAIAYGEDHSVITMEAEVKEHDTVIRFSNVGQSLTAEECARIFDKFYRLDTARQTNSGGAGLGLAIAKELVEMHGGTVRAVSNKQDMTFEISLPHVI